MRSFFFILFVPFTVIAQDKMEEKYEKSSLCTAYDTIFFSCNTKNQRIISLCGKYGDDESIQTVYYRFGKRNRVELEYPANKKESALSLFQYNYYHRYMTNYYNISFQNREYKYVIEDYRNHDENEKTVSYRLSVYSNSDDLVEKASFSCTSNIISNLHPLVNILSCDKENALGCSK